LRVEVAPQWSFRLPARDSLDGLFRVRGGVLHRLLHAGETPVVVRVAQPAPGRVVFGAAAADRDAAVSGIDRMRVALGVDDDLRPFYDRFRSDPLIGRSVRRRPHLRLFRRPEPFEALAWAITEQLIEVGRAAQIQRRLAATLGRRCPDTALRDAPDPARVAATSPARLQSLDLSGGRSRALHRAAREVAAGRIDLAAGPGAERGWRRLRAIPGIGSWTVEMLASTGQGRYDQLPAGDLGYRKLVARLRTGDPRGRVEEDEVRDFFAPYAPWGALAGAHLVGAARGASALA